MVFQRENNALNMALIIPQKMRMYTEKLLELRKD